MSQVVSVGTAQPEHALAQSSAREFCRALFEGAYPDIERLLEVFESAQIEERRVSAPIDWFRNNHSFAEKNTLYISVALRLCELAAQRPPEGAGLTPSDVDHLIFVSTTGLATPSLDAQLMNRMGFAPHTRRTPVWGLGCAGGASGLARASEWADLTPGSNVLLIAVELCSLTFQSGDLSKSNLVATALFADGAAAVVLQSAKPRRSDPARVEPAVRPGAPNVVASRSTLFADTQDVMGWEINDEGLKVIFSRDIPSIVRRLVRRSAEEFLAEYGLTLQSVDHVIAHPGGTKVMSAYEDAFGLGPSALDHARNVLRRAGNMSSPTVLFVLARFLGDPQVRPGDWGLLTALGPGFSSELVLLQW